MCPTQHAPRGPAVLRSKYISVLQGAVPVRLPSRGVKHVSYQEKEFYSNQMRHDK